MEWRDSAAHYIKKIKSRKKDVFVASFLFLSNNLFLIEHIIIRSQSGLYRLTHCNNYVDRRVASR